MPKLGKLAQEIAKGRTMFRMTEKKDVWRGVDEAINYEGPARELLSSKEPRGLYFAKDFNDLAELRFSEIKPPWNKKDIDGPEMVSIARYGEEAMEQPKLLKAKVRKGVKPRILDAEDPERWAQVQGEFQKTIQGQSLGLQEESMMLTQYLRKNYDLVIFPDVIMESTTPQIVAINPGFLEGKLGSKTKILSAALASGFVLKELTGPDEASASPLGVFNKMRKIPKGEISSTSKLLKGQTFQGRKIKEVLKGKNEMRDVVFTNGEHMTISKQEAHNLSRAVGTQSRMNAFNEKNSTEQFRQALSSLAFHENRSTPFATRDTVRLRHELYLKDVRTAEQGLVPETVFVIRNGKYFQMPKAYAELLQNHGILKIDKSTRSQKVLDSTARKGGN